MSDRPFITARLLFDPNLAVVCFCGRPMTTRLREATFGGPLTGEHGQDSIERRCEPCNVQIDIAVDV